MMHRATTEWFIFFIFIILRPFLSFDVITQENIKPVKMD